MMTNNTNDMLNKIAKTYICKNCNSEYKHHSSLCKHVKTCKIKPQLHPQINVTSSDSPDYISIISRLINQNNELMNFIVEMSPVK